MRRSFAIVLLALAPTLSAQTLREDGFRIRLPQTVQPEKALIMIAVPMGRAGVRVQDVQTQPGVREYPLDLDNVDYMKIVVYVPGYRVVARDFRGAALNTATFAPPLVPLGTVRLEGRLVDSSTRPLSNQVLNLTYDFIEPMRYFDVMLDGQVKTLALQQVATNDAGVFAFEVPAFADDPFFQQTGSLRYLQIAGGGPRPAGLDITLKPAAIAIQKVYDKPLLLVKTRPGSITGRLGAEFLRKNNLPDVLRPDSVPEVRPNQTVSERGPSVRLDAEPEPTDAPGPRVIGYNAMLKADGTFDVQLPPGRYVLRLAVLGADGVLERRIIVEESVVVFEGRASVVQVP